MAVFSTSSRWGGGRPSTPATFSSASEGDLPLTTDSPSPRLGALDALAVTAAFALALALFFARQWQIAGTLGLASFPLDDSWIHQQFARNIAEGHGFAYNPDVPVGGSTAPLWTLILATGFVLFGSHPFWAKVAGIAATLATALLAVRLTIRWASARWLAVLAGVVTAIAGPLVWGALSGMEVSLAALLVTAALLVHTEGRDWTTALLLGLAALARPETLLLVPLVWLARPVSWRRTAIFAAVTAVCLAPWVAFNLVTVGSPLPATAAAKVDGGLIGLFSGARQTARWALFVRPNRFELEWVRWLWSVNVLLPALILLGLWSLWHRRGRALAWPAMALVLQPVAMVLVAPFRGPAFQEGRYSMHLLPLAVTVAVVGLDGLARWPRFRALVAASFLLASVMAAPAAADRYAWAVQNIDAMQVHLGHWVAEHTAPNALVALNDVGAIAYVSRRPVIDVMGLVTPAIIPYRKQGERGVLRYLEETCPDYLIVFPAWFPQISAMTDRFRPVYRLRLEHNLVSGAEEMVVYETPWSRARPERQPCPGRSRL